MVAGPTRPDGTLHEGLTAWLRATAPTLGTTIHELHRPSSGWSNETVVVGTDATRFVVRLPALVPAYPDYDLAGQQAVLGFLANEGIRVPRPIALEDDHRWLDAPFLVMECVAGHALADAPPLCPILRDATAERRRHIHEAFLDELVAVHRAGNGQALPGLRHGLDEELAYWSSYLDWATAGAPPQRLVDALNWCSASRPDASAETLLWGDARLGNAMYDDGELTALLDWELATIGPPEMDLAWYVALGELATSFVGPNPDGMLTNEELLERYAEAVASRTRDLLWHRVFALVRSSAVNECIADLARAHGRPYPGVAGDANPLLDVIWATIRTTEA